MKSAVKYILHKLFGFKNYLFLFSIFKIYTLKKDKNEKDFFYFLKLIPKDKAVLDIGANIGIMAVHLAKHVNKVNVHCFEPIPANVNALKRIVSYFKLQNIKIYETALGNEKGQIEMVMPIIDSVRMQGLSHVMHSSIKENNAGEKFNVSINKLDNIELLKNEQLGAIKIDVENFEFFVLQGATNLIKKNRPIVYAELWDNENRLNCFEFFKMLNYSVLVVFDEVLVDYVSGQHISQNFIFRPN